MREPHRCRLTFFGAAEEVTGSLFLLETKKHAVVIDCGLFQGRRQESRERNRHLPDAAKRADACLLTHAHIDHSGNLPGLVKQGFAGPIHSTRATRDLCEYMLRDCARIQEGDAEYLNRKYEDDPDFVTVEPLYDERDAARALAKFTAHRFGTPFEPVPGIRATFLHSGHILGSAQIVVEIEEIGHTVLFTGDLGRRGLPILPDPDRPPKNLDAVVMESTYGNRVHKPLATMHDDLERIVAETVAKGGKIVVPAFALGRTQELLYVLNELKRAGRLPDVPVFIDSPLAVNVTSVFRDHADDFDEETRAFAAEHGDPFGFEGVQFVSAREDSIALNGRKGPAVIISASGMAEAGRILHHLRNTMEDARNTILIVGYMAQHTVGRRLVERRPKIRIFGVERDLRARVEVLNSFSAHADRNDLLEHAHACGRRASLYLVHGEPDQQEPLKAALEGRGHAVTVPKRGETVYLTRKT